VEHDAGIEMGGGEYTGGNQNDDVKLRVDDLTKRVEKTEARGSGEVFEMDQFLFASYSDLAQMVFDKKAPTSGVFWDLFSVLVSMRPKGLSRKERADEQYSSKRIKTTMFENNLLFGRDEPALSSGMSLC
jgi:hypothetical protein